MGEAYLVDRLVCSIISCLTFQGRWEKQGLYLEEKDSEFDMAEGRMKDQNDKTEPSAAANSPLLDDSAALILLFLVISRHLSPRSPIVF